MRKRLQLAIAQNASSDRQRGGARDGARTMARCLWAAIILANAAATTAWQQLLLPAQLHSSRIRRSADATHHMHIFGWHLDLKENHALRSPYYNECRFYKGKVLNENLSSASVTDCQGQIYALLQVNGEEFVLQPANQPEGAHVLRRRDVLMSEQPAAYNLTGDTILDLELDFDESDEGDALSGTVNNFHTDVEYIRSMPVVTRPISGIKGLWLELAIVADYTMLKFHGKDRVKHYILALMNIVSAIFNDPSLNSNMTLVINKLYLYEEKDSIIKYSNVRKSLEAVNKWNYRHLIKLSENSTGWDATIWLTRAQLGGPSGFAPVGGVCSRTRSAALVRDEGLTSAFVIAHELGHLLGLTHDGDVQCEPEARKGSVMAPTVLATLHNYAWSSCSRDKFHEKSKTWWCLLERSNDEGVELGGTKELSNYIFTMDEQCRTEFGEGFSVCKTVKVRSVCTRLWCAHRAIPHVCRSKRAPPLEGTPCGSNHWCVERVCEPMPGNSAEKKIEENPMITPQWDEWDEWSDCSADCGYGLRTRSRRCRFRGSILESSCEGAGSQVATCWAGVACSATTRDIRVDICRRQAHNFIPRIHPEESRHCETWCVSYLGGEAATFGSLPDGTPCSYDKPFDLCYQGTCVKGECNLSDKACNWCPDGYCNNNTHIYVRRLGRGWSRMAVIPHEARLLSVHISTPAALRVAIRERRRDKPIIELNKHQTRRLETKQNNYLKYDPNVPQNLQIIEVNNNVIDIKEEGWEGEVVSAGALLQWKQTDTDIFISSLSQLQTDLMIMAIPENTENLDQIIPVEVSVNFSTPIGRSRPMAYRWTTERGPCSVSCDGGVREVRPRCVHSDSCAPPRYEICNTHKCEYVWMPGEWEECSATCGDKGVQERQLFCIPSNISIHSTRDRIKNSVSPALCSRTSPEKVQPCNRIPCPVYWQEMPWTPCSTTCGRGVSRRPLVCYAADDLFCGPKPRERRRRCRLRRCPTPNRPQTTCATTDAAQYCELFTLNQLKRNCLLPPFKKYCCNACMNAEDNKDIG